MPALRESVERAKGTWESLPLPLYFDLKNVQLGARTPTASEAIEDCLRYGWTGTEATSFGSAQVNELIDSGAVMIFDGLDEVLVRLTKYNGQVFTNQLLKYLSEARERWEKSDKRQQLPVALYHAGLNTSGTLATRRITSSPKIGGNIRQKIIKHSSCFLLVKKKSCTFSQ